MTDTQRILLVDDDPAVRASLTFALELEGFGVEAFDCSEALIARSSRSGDACLVLDYRLPGLDGLSTLALLRSQGVGLPAVIITSNPTRALRNAIASSGAALIEKPLLCDALTIGIRSQIQEHPAIA